MKTPLTEYWKLLETMEDYLKDGLKRDHPEPPLLGRGGRKCGSPAESSGEAEDSLELIACEVAECTACGLSRTRHNVVPGEGVAERPLIMIIGEAPGGEEDKTGHPFVGPAGQYLDKWLTSIGLSRESSCFIGNIIKCRPPANRDPYPEEQAACRPFLDRQIRLLQPVLILTVGRIAAQILLETEDGIGRLRGQTYSYLDVPLIPTYHPAGVLRNPQYRAGVWEDLKRVKSLLESLGY